MKRCSRCKEDKPRAAFASNKAARGGLQAYCRECWSAYHQARQLAKGKNVRPRVEAPPGHKYCRACGRARHLKRNYNLTESQRDEMIAEQKGLCVICLKAPAVHVDHCHETGRVRGVLCFNCNSAIGKLGDDPDAVRRAASYLEGISWKPTLVAPGVYQLPS
ncbi:endonuclease VII domain-containing protein [Streptomyces roseirectus]|uniref:Endonuclease VII domain-containing protein n=1 Tax=Streptomyces roseirectus TaxID=2768066 RepID=A0A7H0ILL1_9ACTN|nr:endonuclease VII domain-containing protein [Streptomyces roseirectus]QNP73677.1 endonuclease VII domain-containing protein [Streptomyces roseirectus]